MFMEVDKLAGRMAERLKGAEVQRSDFKKLHRETQRIHRETQRQHMKNLFGPLCLLWISSV